MSDKEPIVHFEGKDMPASKWIDLMRKRQRRRFGETMAEQWQRQKPATYDRNYSNDGKDDHGMSAFTMHLGLVDTKCRLELADDGRGFMIFFSDGSSYQMNLLLQ